MTFDEAEKKLLKLAAGDYCFIGEGRNTFLDGSQVIRFHVNTYKKGDFYGSTWESALSNLKQALDQPTEINKAEGA